MYVSRSRDREREVDAEDEEEAYERKKLERRLREKEAAYQEVSGVLLGISCARILNLRDLARITNLLL